MVSFSYAKNKACIWIINILIHRSHIYSKGLGSQNYMSVATFLHCHAMWHFGLGRGYRSMIDVISGFRSDIMAGGRNVGLTSMW